MTARRKRARADRLGEQRAAAAAMFRAANDAVVRSLRVPGIEPVIDDQVDELAVALGKLPRELGHKPVADLSEDELVAKLAAAKRAARQTSDESR